MLATTIYVGIDVSKDKLDVAWQVDGKWHEKQVANTWSSVESLVSTLQTGLGTWHALVEFTGTYSSKVVAALHDAGIALTMLRPKQSSSFRQMRHQTSKTDRMDARLLSDYGRLNADGLPLYVQASQADLHRRQLLDRTIQLEKMRQQVKNQRHSYQQYPPHHQQANILQSYDQQLTDLETAIGELEAARAELDQADQSQMQLAALMQSVTGIGKQTVAIILAFIGSPLRFDNAKQLSKYAGCAPTHYQSGSSVRGRGSINRSGVAIVRSVLYCCTWSAIRFNHACKALFERLRQRGKPIKVARIAVVNLLLRQLFAVVKSGIPFDNQRVALPLLTH